MYDQICRPDNAVGIADCAVRAGRSGDRIPMGATQPPAEWVSLHSRGVKRAGSVVNHPISSNAEFKVKVELCNYSPSLSSWQAVERNLP